MDCGVGGMCRQCFWSMHRDAAYDIILEIEGISEGVGGEGVGIVRPSLVAGTTCFLATQGGLCKAAVGSVRCEIFGPGHPCRGGC